MLCDVFLGIAHYQCRLGRGSSWPMRSSIKKERFDLLSRASERPEATHMVARVARRISARRLKVLQSKLGVSAPGSAGLSYPCSVLYLASRNPGVLGIIETISATKIAQV